MELLLSFFVFKEYRYWFFFSTGVLTWVAVLRSGRLARAARLEAQRSRVGVGHRLRWPLCRLHLALCRRLRSLRGHQGTSSSEKSNIYFT